jgi:hypothetical protein
MSVCQVAHLWNFLGEVRRTLLPRRRTTMCHSSDSNGKMLALQRPTARQSARGTLRAEHLRQERHPRDRMFIRLPDILWLPVRRLGCESWVPEVPSGRLMQGRMCRFPGLHVKGMVPFHAEGPECTRLKRCATATNTVTGDTSEFSRNFIVSPPG